VTGEIKVLSSELRGYDILIVVDEVVRVVEKGLRFVEIPEARDDIESMFRVSKALVSSALASPILSMPSSTILR